jgi:hypothetical protein
MNELHMHLGFLRGSVRRRMREPRTVLSRPTSFLEAPNSHGPHRIQTAYQIGLGKECCGASIGKIHKP